MMQANWSLILNALLLIGVIVAIGRLMKARRQSFSMERFQPNPNIAEEPSYEAPIYNDDIIAVRKITADPVLESSSFKSAVHPSPRLIPDDEEEQITLKAQPKTGPRIDANIAEIEEHHDTGSVLMMFLLAKENRLFAGYELLQTVLAAGLRFGEGGLFHRHQFTNGDGTVLCSLAAATATGTFDLQNIGAFSVRGLCLYMKSTNNSEIDAERFSVMLETARQLSEGLDAHLLDDQRRSLTEERLAHYYRVLQLDDALEELVAV